VALALGAPDARAERRQHYARLLFGSFTDGRNHVRVAERILALGAATAPAEVAAPGGRMGGGGAAELWHDVRTRLWSSTPLRRLVLGPLEQVRLRARGVMCRPRPVR
jgi:hypothetical protein